MNVLFVDDEPRILEGIERMLSQFDLDWTLSFAESGAQALEKLDANAFDVIVSDMRMAQMDGAALLKTVCQRHPQVVRIVLSGQTDEESAMRVVRVAHQFLAKPCRPETLRCVIERTRELKMLLDDPNLQANLGQVDRLPSAPRLFSEISKLLEDEHTDADAITRIVQQDPAMASKILQVVNSSFFAASSTVRDLKTAVVRLGIKTLRNLVLGVGAFQGARERPGVDVAQVDSLQRHSVRVARLAARIAPRENADEAFMAGLVCEIGQLLLASAVPERQREAQALALARGVELEVAERELLGASHAEVGAFLLGIWGLPFPIVEAVANHHMPERNAHTRWGMSQAVWLAECLVSQLEPDPEYLTAIGVSEKLADFRRLADNLESE